MVDAVLPSSVLFACSRNAVRSPMAAALAQHYLGRRMFIGSAGVEPGTVDPFIVAVMAELGLDLETHKPKSFDDLDIGSFELIVTLSPEAHHRALDLTRTWSIEVEYWPTPDPTLATELSANRETILESYRAVREMLDKKIRTRFVVAPPASL